MKFGYARVSTKDQNLDLQVIALKEYGCQQIVTEKKGATKERANLEELVGKLRKGDTLVVWKLDRLGRSLKDLVERVTYFENQGIDFISLKDNINTTTPQGTLIFHLFASFAEFERAMISERTKAGLRAARAKGHFAGRKPGLTETARKKARLAYTLSKDPEYSVVEITKDLKISKSTYYRYVEFIIKERLGGKT